MIIGLQLLAFVFSLVMIYFAYVHYRRGELSAFEVLFWIISWCIAILIAIFPQIFGAIAQTFAISRALDLAIIGALLVILPMVYLSYIRTKRLEQRIEKFIRSQALTNISHGKTKPHRS